MIEIELPGVKNFCLSNLLMDFNGTLAVDGYLIDGVAQRLKELAAKLDLVVLTADTFGLVNESCRGLPITIQKIHKGREQAQKLEAIKRMGAEKTAAIGNGANDLLMLKESILGVCVIGREGVSVKTLISSDICVPTIISGLDLFLSPKRIIATLRV